MTITEGSITDVVVATTAQDAAAAQAVRQHHAELADALAVRVEALLATAAAGGEPFEDARRLAFGFLAGDPVRAAATGYALQVLFEAHLTKENDLVLPVVAADPAVSLAEILAGMHELLGQDGSPLSGPHSHGHDHGRCGCGESDSGTPELDVRAIPHAIRHATVFGAFDAIPPGGSMVLIASHDPQPLLRQLAVRTDGRLDVAYLERGPEAWRLQLTRL